MMTDRSGSPEPNLDLVGTRAVALAGIRVLDLANEFATYTSRLLGDLGAEVIRVEPPGGSSTRRVAPLISRRSDGTELSVSAFDQFVNAGKRSMTLDLEQSDGRQLFRRLVAKADVVVETYSLAEA
ncbi:MAG: CoA transferase, partial [Candidatus Limnocylindrales bacterium]